MGIFTRRPPAFTPPVFDDYPAEPDGVLTVLGLDGRASLYADVVVLDFRGPRASEKLRAVSPRQIPLGAISEVSVRSDAYLTYLAFDLRGHPPTQHTLMFSPNAIILGADTDTAEFIEDLTQYAAHCPQITDFEPPPPPPRPLSKRAQKRLAGGPRESPLLDWLSMGD